MPVRLRASCVRAIAFVTAASLVASPALSQGVRRSQSPQAEWLDPLGPLIVTIDRDGRCAMLWIGQPVTEPQLLARGADFIRRVVQRVGGAPNVTAGNFPSANLRIADDVRYRCIAPVLRTLSSSGFMEVRIENGDAFHNANPLVFWMDLYTPSDRHPPIDPIKNVVQLSAIGVLSWNGEPTNFVTLRQYLDLTMTMNPVPLLKLDFDPEARFRVVRSALEVVWRARVERVELELRDSRGRKAENSMSFRPTYLVKRARRR